MSLGSLTQYAVRFVKVARHIDRRVAVRRLSYELARRSGWYKRRYPAGRIETWLPASGDAIVNAVRRGGRFLWGERREEWQILAGIGERLGFRAPFEDGEGFARVAHMMKSTGVSFDAVRAAPRGTLLPPLEAGHFFDEHLQTADGRVDCRPPIFDAAVERCEEIFRELAAEPATVLKLITRRDPFMHNSWFHNVARMKARGRVENPIYLHPEDARERGLADGQRVEVWNAHGRLEAPICYDEGLARGVVAMTHGWGHARTPGMRLARETPGSNSNVLLPIGPGSYETLSNQAHMTGIRVEVRAATGWNEPEEIQ